LSVSVHFPFGAVMRMRLTRGDHRVAIGVHHHPPPMGAWPTSAIRRVRTGCDEKSCKRLGPHPP
jgi:hypothetical protein